MNKQFVTAILAMFALLIMSSSCKKTPTGNKMKAPEVITMEVTNVTDSSAQSGGTIISEGGSKIIARGVCWSRGKYPTITERKTNDGAGTGAFNSDLTHLMSSTAYYVRAYATNEYGTGYGSTMAFTTFKEGTGTVTDVDGNVYRTVKIGNQWWMAENLKVTHYRNGDEITYAPSVSDWRHVTGGAYCFHSNNPNNMAIYGLLYNWWAVDDSRGLAPEGYHIPSYEEWQTLVAYVGGIDSAGGKLKEAGTAHWYPPNQGATNESGFSALPGGARGSGGGVAYSIGGFCVFWSSSLSQYGLPLSVELPNNSLEVHYYTNNERKGYSVRCIRD